MSTPTLSAKIFKINQEASRIRSIEFRPAESCVEFPSFTAGSHIDLHLPCDLIRSYSLCNSQDDLQRYVVAVLDDKNSRGGSRFVHDHLKIGMTIPISRPRNNFVLDESAEQTVLVAGGIGITPLYSMLQRLHSLKAKVTLLYLVRSRAEAAFLEGANALIGNHVTLILHVDDEEGGPADLRKKLAPFGSTASYYGCGPNGMLDAFTNACEQLAYPNVHVERFSGSGVDIAQRRAFLVELRQTGLTLKVAADQSLLDCLLDAGLNPDYGCKEGVCGACEARVLEGTIDHRDKLLSAAEKKRNKTMLICVSGCKSDRLVLDM